jgi:hypothetical protein
MKNRASVNVAIVSKNSWKAFMNERAILSCPQPDSFICGASKDEGKKHLWKKRNWVKI